MGANGCVIGQNSAKRDFKRFKRKNRILFVVEFFHFGPGLRQFAVPAGNALPLLISQVCSHVSRHLKPVCKKNTSRASKQLLNIYIARSYFYIVSQWLLILNILV